jgi:hypothetical protein
MVVDFYLSDSNNRQCTGTKEYISVHRNHQCLRGKNIVPASIERQPRRNKVYMQKRLLLSSVAELYAAFMEENKDSPSAKIGRSKFAELRPPWCVSPGSWGTHNVCICIHHQNPKLMVIAMNLEEDITSLMARLVCSLDNEQCMLQKCQSRPSTDKLLNHLQSCLDSADWITYKQWMHTDRTNLVEISEPVSEFIDKLVKKLKDLLVHSFIAKNKQILPEN